MNAGEREFILALDANNRDDLEAIKAELIGLREDKAIDHTRFYVWLTALTVAAGGPGLMFLAHLFG